MTRNAPACTACELHAESVFKIEGMDCREEVALLERRFKNLPGIEHFTADVMGQRLHVKYDAARVSTSGITAAVADTGMVAWLEHEEAVGRVRDRRGLFLLTASSVLMGGGLAASLFDPSSLLTRSLFVTSVVAGIPLTIGRARRAVRMRTLDINVLMLVAVAGAMMLGQWSEAAAVVVLFGAAQALESFTLDRARNAVRALMELTPAEALVREEGGDQVRPVDAIRPGMIVVVKPGEKIPLDGDIAAGTSAVNQAPVTGESIPVDKGPGDEVLAGTINGRGALDIRVTRLRRDSTVSRIIHLVERAQSRRAPVQTLVERFARIYTPVVLVLAVVLAVAPPLAWGEPWHVWVYRALVLLVISCPCALVISTPVSVVAALAGAARKGLLIKGGVHLERASKVRCVAFDKTGTLTKGAPEVLDVVAFNGRSADRLLALAASVEQRAGHPIARAILHHAESRRLTAMPAVDVRVLAGLGAEGLVDGSAIVLGNHRLFDERGLCTPAMHTQLAEYSAGGRTPVLVARNGEVIGVILVADRPREAGRATVEMLREQGIESIVMLTGDGEPTARAIAAEMGIDEVRAELMPDDKVAAVEDLRRRYGTVAMVGDGVNDAPAMAAADVGIAMGAAGSDVALETADIALMADELLKIPFALRLSRATLRNVKANLALSLVMKGAFVVAAIAGVATLWMAVLADTGASIVVIANALRLLRTD